MRLALPLLFVSVVMYAPHLSLAATEEQCAFLKLQAPAITCDTSTPWEPKIWGGCEKNPYPILEAAYTPGTQSKLEGRNGILKLNPDFACRLSTYIQAHASSCRVTIFSAYRSPETQARIYMSGNNNNPVAKPPCSAGIQGVPCGKGSNHNYGMAADIHFNGASSPSSPSCRAAWSGARSFKLHFPVSSEDWHVEPIAPVTGGEGRGTADSGSRAPSGGDSGPPSPSAPSPLSSLLGGLTGQGSQECSQYQQQCQAARGYSSACMLYAQKCQQNQGAGNPLSNLLSNLFGGGQQGGTPSAPTAPTTVTTPVTPTTPTTPVTPPITVLMPTTTSTTTATTTATTTPALSSTTVQYLLNGITTLTPTTTVATTTTIARETIELPRNGAVTNTFTQQEPVQPTVPRAQATPLLSLRSTLATMRNILEGLLALFKTPTPSQQRDAFDDTEPLYDFASGTNPFIVEEGE